MLSIEDHLAYLRWHLRDIVETHTLQSARLGERSSRLDGRYRNGSSSCAVCSYSSGRDDAAGAVDRRLRQCRRSRPIKVRRRRLVADFRASHSGRAGSDRSNWSRLGCRLSAQRRHSRPPQIGSSFVMVIYILTVLRLRTRWTSSTGRRPCVSLVLGPRLRSATFAEFPLPDPVHDIHPSAEVFRGYRTTASAGCDGTSRTRTERVDCPTRSHWRSDSAAARRLRSYPIGSDVYGCIRAARPCSRKVCSRSCSVESLSIRRKIVYADRLVLFSALRPCNSCMVVSFLGHIRSPCCW